MRSHRVSDRPDLPLNVEFVATKKGMSKALAVVVTGSSGLFVRAADQGPRHAARPCGRRGRDRGRYRPEDVIRTLVGMCYQQDQPGWQASVLRLGDVFADGLAAKPGPPLSPTSRRRASRTEMSARREKAGRQREGPVRQERALAASSSSRGRGADEEGRRITWATRCSLVSILTRSSTSLGARNMTLRSAVREMMQAPRGLRGSVDLHRDKGKQPAIIDIAIIEMLYADPRFAGPD